MMVGNFLSNKLNYLFWLVVHTWLLFSIICEIILPIDFIFFKMVKTTNQLLNVVEPTMTSLHPLPKVHHYPPKEMAADVGPSVAPSLHRWTQRGGDKNSGVCTPENHDTLRPSPILSGNVGNKSSNHCSSFQLFPLHPWRLCVHLRGTENIP